MKLFLILIALLSTAVFAQKEEQSGLIKTDAGVLIVWNQPGNYFTLEVKGKNISTPAARMLNVDGKFFQLQIAEKKEVLKDATGKALDDKAILTAHRDWERDHVAGLLKHELKVESEWIRLPNGSDALWWYFDMPKVSDDQTAKRQVFLTTVKREHIIVLNSALTDLADARDTKELLLQSLYTLKPSDKPLNLHKLSEMIRKGN